MQQTPLFHFHQSHKGKIVDFAGFAMPVDYGSQVQEHHQVRNDAGLFDVGHMGIVDLHGNRTREMLRYLMANDVARVDGKDGKAIYTCMLNQQGGVIDDLIITRMSDIWYRIVVNAATKEKDMQWLSGYAHDFGVDIALQNQLTMIAAQGPNAREYAHKTDSRIAVAGESLTRFMAAEQDGIFVSRTGYTGEDGYELIVPVSEVEELAHKLVENGVKPCGLGARDTLRLEAGMNLYGHDMSETTSPWQSGLSWTVWLKDESRDFIGRKALLQQQQDGVVQQLVAIVLQAKGVLRDGQKVFNSAGEGIITSGSFSPTLSKGIALARVPQCDDKMCEVEVRGKRLAAEVVQLPFVKKVK